MSRSDEMRFVPHLIRWGACLLMLSGLSLSAQSYQSSFSEVKYDRAKTPAGFHGIAEVDVPSGAVNINIPLGPGIGARGVEFRPRLTGRMGYNARPQFGYRRELYQGSFDPNLGYYVYYPMAFLLAIQDNGLEVGPGGLSIPVLGINAAACRPARWTLPDGTSATGSRVGADHLPSDLDLLRLLGRFTGFDSGWDLCRTGNGPNSSNVFLGSHGELLFAVTHSSLAPWVTLPGGARSENHIPYQGLGGSTAWPTVQVFPRVVMVVGDVLYDYEFSEAEYLPTPSESYIPKMDRLVKKTNSIEYREFPNRCYDSQGQLILQDLDSLHYHLKRIVNKTGDEIVFVYDRLSYSATWKLDGAVLGTIRQNTPNTASGQATLSYESLSSPESYTMIYTAPPDAGGAWKTLKRGSFYKSSDGTWDEKIPLRNPEFPLSLTAITQVTCDQTQETISFEFDENSGSRTEIASNPDGSLFPAGPLMRALKRVVTPGKSTTFSWTSALYRRNAFENADSDEGFMGYVAPDLLPNGSVGGVSEVIEEAGGVQRRTRYTRTLPDPTPFLQDFPNTWTSTSFFTVITYPDSSISIQRYVSPINNKKSGSPLDGSTLDEQMQTLAHLKHQIVEIREYPMGATGCVDDLANAPSSSSAYRITLFDRWDVRTLGNPSGGLLIGSIPYPTRTRTWSKDTGMVEESEKLDWDSSNRGWKTSRKMVRALGETDLSTIEYRSSALQGLATPAYPTTEAGRNERRTMSSVPAEWIWDRTETQNATAYDGMAALELPGVKNTWEIQNGYSRLISVDTTTGSATALTTTLLYAGTSGAKIPQLQSAKVTGTGLNLTGSVGVSQYTYDDFGFLSGIKPLGAGWTLGQVNDVFGRATSQTRADGLIIGVKWANGGRLDTITPPGNEFPSSYAFDSDSLGVTITRGVQKTHLRYNGFGELVRETRTNGNNSISHRNFGYDQGGRKIWETVWMPNEGTDSGWSASASSWDNPPSSRTICCDWGPARVGEPNPCIEWCTETYPGDYSQLINRTLYDNRGRPWRIINANGEVIDTFYDLGSPTGGIGLVSKRSTYTQGATSPAYEPSGSLITTFEKDALGRMVKITDPMGQVTQYQYDPADRITKVTQWAGAVGSSAKQERTWHYNPLGRLDVLAQPESGTTTYSNFDVTGKPWRTDYNGRAVASSFDGLGHPLSVVSDDLTINQAFTWGMDADIYANKLKTVSSSTGAGRTLDYDPATGRLSTLKRTVDNLPPFIQAFGHDSYGRLNSRTYPDLKIHKIAFQDCTDLPKSTSFDSTTAFANFDYFPDSLALRKVAYTNGAYSDFAYRNDQTGLAFMSHTIPGKPPAKTWSFAYDGAGRLLTDGEDSYTYDPLGRLKTAAVVDLQVTAKGLFQTFDYDAFGNRVLAQTDTVTNWVPPAAVPATLNRQTTLRTGLNTPANSSFNKADHNTIESLAKNRLPATTATGASTGAQYDAQGNLIQTYPQAGLSSSPINLTYDALARVSSICSGTNAARLQESYLHDDEGLRIRMWDGTKIRYNIYNEARQLIAQYEKTPTGPLTWKKDIVYVGTKEIAEVSSDGKTYITMTDHLGSPRFIWSGGSDPVIQQKFLPFGEQLSDPTSMGKVAKGFTNHEQTDASGLIYMQARFYLPMWGRFASPDPARDQHFEETQSWNIYSYVQNNPVMMVDPDGQLKRDAKGKLVKSPMIRGMGSIRISEPSFKGHSGDTSKQWRTRDWSLTTDDGKGYPIGVQNLDKDARMNFDCHGLTFAKGDIWIDNSQVSTILKGDGYNETSKPQVGDIGVYYMNGDVQHSVTVSGVDKDGNVTGVAGLGGIETQVTETTPQGGWKEGATIKYYKKGDDKRTEEQRKKDVEELKKIKKPEGN